MAEMSSALQTATGSDHGLLAAGSGVNATALYHMYVTGATSLFNYGDHGPNKVRINESFLCGDADLCLVQHHGQHDALLRDAVQDAAILALPA